MPALVGLLLVVFAIAGLLVYEAWSTGRSRLEIAERGLQDYAAYASWSAARTGENILTASLSTLFRGVAGNRVGPGEQVAPINALLAGAQYLENCDCAMNLPVDYYFRYDAGRGALDTRPFVVHADPNAETGWAAAKVGTYTSPAPLRLIVPDDDWLRSSLSGSPLERLPNFALYFDSQNG